MALGLACMILERGTPETDGQPMAPSGSDDGLARRLQPPGFPDKSLTALRNQHADGLADKLSRLVIEQGEGLLVGPGHGQLRGDEEHGVVHAVQQLLEE